MDPTPDLHQHHCRPGVWGAGFVVLDADHPDGFVVHTFEHVQREDGSWERRRIAMEAMARGFAPCTPYREREGRRVAYSPRRPVIRYCFEIGVDGTAYPHLRGHPEWLQPQSEDVLTILERLGLRRPDGHSPD